MNYEQASDPEINKAVAIHLNHAFKLYSSVVMIDAGREFVEFDPCNNPADTWPIMLENKISAHPYASSEHWFACDALSRFYSPDTKNPLRAAMIVFLMMSEGKQ